MNQIGILTMKELRSYFLSPIAYIFLTVFLLLTNFLFFQGFFVANEASMRTYFALIPWVYLLFIPTVTMRSFAEEKKNKTIELLLTWPLSDTTVVFGKFFAATLFISLALLLSVTVPLSVMVVGNPDVGVILTSYLGAVLLGSAYAAIGLWVSSLTENQIVAFIGSVVFILILLLIGNEVVTLFVPTVVATVLREISLMTHFASLTQGVIDSRDILYYFSVTGFFLFLNVLSLGSRKWER